MLAINDVWMLACLRLCCRRKASVEAAAARWRRLVLLARLLAESRAAYGASGDFTKYFARKREASTYGTSLLVGNEARATRVRRGVCELARECPEESPEAIAAELIRGPRARHLARFAVGAGCSEMSYENEWWAHQREW